MQTMQTIRTDVITSCWEEMRCRESSDQTGISCLKQDWETKCLLLKQRPWDVTSRILSKEPTIEKRPYLDLAETRVRDGISSIKYLPREMNWAPTVCHITFILYLFLRGKVAQTWPTKLQILAMNLVSHPFCRASRLVFLFFFAEYTFGSSSFLYSVALRANKYFIWKEMRLDGLMMMSLLSCISTPKN